MLDWISWKCPNCGFRWQNAGEGIAPYRRSKCPQCGTEVSEQEDVDRKAGATSSD